MQWELIIDGAAAGLLAHHGLFIRGEWHLATPSVILGHAALSMFAWWYSLRYESATFLEHSSLSALFLVSYIAALLSSIISYRLFFHRLRRFPGPRAAATSKFWHIIQCKDGTNFRLLESMRRQYGQFVRTG